MPAYTHVPASYDQDFIRDRAGVAAHFGWDDAPDNQKKLYFLASAFDAVQAVIETYPVDYLEVELPNTLNAITEERRARVEAFTFNGFTIPLDMETKANLIGAAMGVQLCEDVTVVDWQVQPGVWMAIPSDVLVEMAKAAFRYTQATFTHARVLSDAAEGCADINELAALDIKAGWPA